MKGLLYRLPPTIIAFYKSKNLIWQIVAVALTIIIVTTGFDWKYYEATRGLNFGFILPAIALGGLIPIIVPLFFLIAGFLTRSVRTVQAGWASGQAAILGLVISSSYKAFTGRIPPPATWRGLGSSTVQTLTDISHGFQFGWLKGGVFWGWPSSHTTVAFALATALFIYYRDKKWIGWIALLWALYVGLGVSVSIHWFSEFVAGLIIGSVIGLTVGKSFKNVIISA